MRTRKILPALLASAAALSVLVAGCDATVGPDCDDISTSIRSTRGDTVVTTSGLRYLEREIGTGETVRSCDLVTVEFVGTLESGAEFDRGSGDVVPGTALRPRGFEEGLVGIRAGGRRRLIVPADLGYGATERRNVAGQVTVPANSTLIYDLFVIEVD